MKSPKKNIKFRNEQRERILKSLIASFNIEGIEIPLNVAQEALKKVELSLGK